LADQRERWSWSVETDGSDRALGVLPDALAQKNPLDFILGPLQTPGQVSSTQIPMLLSGDRLDKLDVLDSTLRAETSP
jgi:hypothetical protein